jgi:two-component system chemotaxis response regulator CheY
VKNLLYVDDDQSMRALIALVLGKHYALELANDGCMALQALQSRPFDLVISDINMPNMDGLQLLAAIRATTEYRHLPVLLMSAETDELIKQHSKQLGATGWISKPFNPEKLLKAIEKVLMTPHD